MEDVDILTKIIRWCNSTTYVTKNGSNEVNAFAKERVLEIINSEND